MQVNWYGHTTTTNIQNLFPLLAVEGLGRPRRQYNPVSPGLWPGAVYGSPTLPPRVVRLVWLVTATSYSDYWSARTQLLSVFNTNPRLAQGARGYGMLQIVTGAGQEARMEAVLTNTIDFPEPRRGWSHRVVTEFSLLHPFWRTGSFATSNVSLASGSASFQLVNIGNVEAGVTFVLVGPMTTINISNTSQLVEWGRNSIQTSTALNLAAGQTATISNRYDAPYRFDLADRFQEPERLIEFRIWPAPYVAGGVNTITVTASGVGSQSRIDYSFVSMIDGL